MRGGRTILLVPAFLVAIVALVALGPAWRERAAPKRAVAPALDGTSSRGLAGDEPPGTPGVDEAETAVGGAVVRGVVTGPTGVLWCARVVAYRGESVVAETWTDPKGLYSIAVEPRVEFDLAVEPAPETGLLATRLAGLSLASGDERLEDVRLEEGASLRGRLVDPDGRGWEGLELFALLPGDFARVEGTFDRTVIASVAVAQTRCARDGRYWLRGIEDGVYSLAICASEWMFPAPVSARTDGPDLSLVVLPALTMDLEVKDVETGLPVDVFSVTARQGDRVLLEGSATAGVFSRRIPFPGRRDPRSLVLLEVAAAGFLPPGRPVNAGSRKHLLWLVPRRDPNTTVRISFDNREPYRGALMVRFWTREGSGGYGHASFERVREGVYRGALPYGRWDLDLIPLGLLGEQRFPAHAEVRAGREAEAALVLPAGGTLLISAPAGAQEPLAWVRSAADAEKDASGRSFQVPPEGLRIEGIPPGAYQVGYQRATEVLEGRFPHETIWFKDVRIEVGGTEEVALPEK